MTANPVVLQLIYDSIDEHNKFTDPSRTLTNSIDTALFGGDGVLDSLELVSLVVAVEERVQDELGSEILIVDDRAVSQARSPFRTVRSLAEYVSQLVKESSNA